MNLVDHARRELALTNEDPEVAASLIAAVEAFAAYDGHSGASHMAARNILHTLLGHGQLSPLTDSPDEWFEPADGLWQSTRRPDAFSTDGGKTYYLVDEPRETRQTYTSAPTAEETETHG